MKSELSAKNTAIELLAVLAIQYGYIIIKWTQAELSKMYSNIRKQINTKRYIRRFDVVRLCVSSKDGGRGMISIEASYTLAKEVLNI